LLLGRILVTSLARHFVATNKQQECPLPSWPRFECYSPIDDISKRLGKLVRISPLIACYGKSDWFLFQSRFFLSPTLIYVQCASRAGHYFLVSWKCPDVIVNFIIRKSLHLFRGCCSVSNIKLQTASGRFDFHRIYLLASMSFVLEELCPRASLFNGKYVTIVFFYLQNTSVNSLI